jgi:two-component system, OmpR family, manganese sensing response regulator
MQILLVDDEIEMAQPVAQILQREGYEVSMVHDGTTGNQMASLGSFDLLILDWMLPGVSGLEICRSLRQNGNMTPVLFLTAKDTLDDRVNGLDAGADDYLIKPFELRELLARVRALLRRPSQISQVAEPISTPPSLKVQDLELNVNDRMAHRAGRGIDLSEKETQLLAYLMQFPNQLLTHDRISAHLWKSEERPASNALAAQIRLLRRKIETPGRPELIHTVYGRGYRFGSMDDGTPE